jgi:hypothetical protein
MQQHMYWLAVIKKAGLNRPAFEFVSEGLRNAAKRGNWQY